MKKTTLILFFLSLVLGITTVEAQKKEKKGKNKVEKQARKMVNEMDKAIGLSKEEFQMVLKIQMDRRTESQKIRNDKNLSQEEQKDALKKLGNKVYNQMKDALGGNEKGKQRMKKWKQYQKDKKNKS